MTIMFSVQNCNFIADMIDFAFSTKIKDTEKFLFIQSHIRIALIGNTT